MNRQGAKGISWTDWSSNPLYVTHNETGKRGWHCVRVSNGVDPSGCDHCYSASMNMGRFGTGLDFIAENDDKVTWHLNEEELRAWARKGKPGRVFPFDMTDLFHHRIPREFVVRAFAAMLLSPKLTFQVLTKRPGAMRAFLSSGERQGEVIAQAIVYSHEWRVPYPYLESANPFPLINVWPGTTVATQKDAAARLGDLKRTPAVCRWVSLEPQLEAVDLLPYFESHPGMAARAGHVDQGRIHWVVQGGESDSDRPFREEWADAMRLQCRHAGVAYFLKQMGEVWSREQGLFGVDSHGKKPAHWPERLRVQQFPDEPPFAEVFGIRPSARKEAA